ncbi:MAG: hypothetical protein L6R41_007444 [Letrouitia leprolyta]|nr:MAG: hypothetical protein L6R41_007444 [Letrouitia leprolyta]
MFASEDSGLCWSRYSSSYRELRQFRRGDLTSWVQGEGSFGSYNIAVTIGILQARHIVEVAQHIWDHGQRSDSIIITQPCLVSTGRHNGRLKAGQGIGTLRSANSVQGAFCIIVTNAKSIDSGTAVDVFEKGSGTAVGKVYRNTGIGNELDCSNKLMVNKQKGKDKLPLHLETKHIDSTFSVQEVWEVREPKDDSISSKSEERPLEERN